MAAAQVRVLGAALPHRRLIGRMLIEALLQGVGPLGRGRASLPASR
jgi:hypothetical protein